MCVCVCVLLVTLWYRVEMTGHLAFRTHQRLSLVDWRCLVHNLSLEEVIYCLWLLAGSQTSEEWARRSQWP